MRISPVSDRGLIRLIPATYHKPPTLRGLVDTDDELEVLVQLEGLTSARLTAERGGNTHLDRRELAFARRAQDLQVCGNRHINAAFTYTRPQGNRFNDGTRGAWYCSWHVTTSVAEVAFHRTRELGYIGIYEDQARYVELLADHIGDFPDLGNELDHPALSPEPDVGYPQGQAIALAFRRAGHRGLIYPSVRRSEGRCLVAFEPSAIQNLRPGASWNLIWSGTPDYTVKSV